MSAARERFIAEAFRLSHAAPQAWREFEQAFALYATNQTEEAVKAPAANALTAHGVAQALLALRDDFQRLETTYAAIERKHRTQSR